MTDHTLKIVRRYADACPYCGEARALRIVKTWKTQGGISRIFVCKSCFRRFRLLVLWPR